jgi:hypothetical protein
LAMRLLVLVAVTMRWSLYLIDFDGWQGGVGRASA